MILRKMTMKKTHHFSAV